MISPEKVSKLIESIEAEFFDPKDIDEIVPTGAAMEVLSDLEKVSPKYFIEYLSQFAHQKIPLEIMALLNGKIPALETNSPREFQIINTCNN
jgi:hypothetical protein